jgi:hypothetical protein
MCREPEFIKRLPALVDIFGRPSVQNLQNRIRGFSMLRKLSAVTAAAALLMSSTLAFAGDQRQADTQQQGALAPGKAAGVEKATGEGVNIAMMVIGLGVVAGGVALALSGSGGGGNGGSGGVGSPPPSTH